MLPPTLPDNLTVLDRILGWATTHADRPALVFVADTGERECWLSYGELGRRCIRLGEELTKRGLGGERALLLFHPGLDFVVAFLGCLHAGVIAVPVYPPHRTRGRERLRSVAADATPFVVLATAELLPRLQALSRDLPELAGLGWLAVDELTQGTPAALAPPAHREALAFLQYTSGSTAEPKGVAVSHQNLLANEEAIRTAFGQSETSVVVGWLPPYHDMGLIGNLLQPLFVGGRSVILPPAAFLREPACWLDAISRHRGTTSGGPNFAFDLCTRKVDPKAVPGLDLRSWVVAFNGAEPIAAETLARFTERFAPCGFSPSAWAPAYGLAEATLLVTTAERRREPTVLGLDATRLAAGEVALTPTSAPRRKQAVACGTPPAGVEVAIVDPATCLPVPAGRIGEIWVAGPSVATGYWGQAATSAAVFAARRGDELAGRWLRTGDLGFVHGAELFVSGRRKELLILRGRNHYPQDLEATARRAHPALLAGQGAATAIDANDEGQAREGLLVVHEVERRPGTPGATGEEIAEAIRRAIADEHEVAVDAVVLLRLGTLPRTSSGKVQRHLCSQFLTGESREVLVRSWRTGSALTEPTVTEPTRTDPEPQPEAAWPAAGAGQPAALPAVLAAAARVSGRPAQDLRGDLPLSDLALDSLAKVELLGALERGLGVGAAGAISLEEIYKAETLDDLARTLAAHLEVGRAKASSVSDGYAATPTAGTDGWLPSAGQRALWLTQKLAPASVAYNLTIAAHIEGPLDADALVTAWRQLVGRHPALRATFAQDAQGRLIARAAQSESSESAQLHREQLASPAELAARQAAISRAPFDLAAGPLVRAYLLAVGSSHLLLLSLHHVVADLWSLTLLARELAALYHEAAGGPSAGLAPPATVPPQPAAAADAERHWPAWQRLLAGMPTLLALPTDRPRATPTSEVAGRVVHLWPLALLGRLEQLAGSVAASLFTVLGAGYAALLSRWTAEGRLVVGSPAAGRLSSGAQAALDYRVNLLPLPFTVPAADSFRQLLESSRAVVDVALAHQELPFPTLVERLVPARDPDRHPVFQVVLSHQGGQRAGGPSLAGFALGIPGSRLALGPAVLCSCDVEPGATPFELALATGQVEGGLGLTLTYRRELFDPTTAGRVLGWLRHLLTAAAADPELPLAALPLLAPAETQQVCREWGDRDGGPAELATLDRQFASAADAYPDSVALVGPEEQVSYRELSRRSRRLAGSLVAHGVGPETRVGLAVGRSSNLVVGILGILGAGGAYVPLDPSYPRERLVAMLARSRPRVVVREEGSAETLLPVLAALGVAELELVGQALPGPAPEVPAPALTGDCAAYLLFTSGSTGEPKGVVITHRAVARLFRAAARWFSLGPEEVWSLAHAYAFDFSVWEMWGALAHGGRVVLLSDEERRSSQQLAERLIDARVSCLSQTPSAFRSLSRYLTPGAAPALRCVVFGGEALSPAAITPWLQAPDGPRLVNMYGITETTVHVTYRELRSADVAPGGSPIGAPLPDLAARVLDRRGQPVGIGIAGELYVAGPGLARGYLDRPAWTAARFVPDAWSAAPGERLYRSGDLVRRLTSSELDYIGRIDAQVQVRGYRVEPAEVETTLQAHPQVLRALVDLEAGGRSSGERLVAWVEVSGEPPRTSEWRAWLGERLPAHAVPSLFVPLTTWPLTPTGKIDRRALPRPAGNGEPLPRPTAGGGSEEQVVRAIWAEVLGRQSVGRDDNFFDLGGHSLLLTEVHGRLERQLGRQVPLLELFRHPTVASLARFLAGDQPTPSAAPAASPRPALEGEIAVVGLAGRFPGAESPAALWELLSSGRSGTVDLEDAELLAAGVAPELLADPAYVRVAAPLAGSDRFDAGFFGYGAREAELLDPQQRVFLECAWEALEDAGHGEPHREAGKVGVFAGAGFSRYLLDLAGDPALVAALGDFPLLVANDKDFLASRVAYKLGLQGPAISVQTACSTSLVAVHLACQSLRDGECDLALAGGVSLADPERAGYLYQQGGILSPDGRCRPFDAAAAGTLRGSGAGVVVLRRLADALADGDAIRAVIKGSAINNDGAEKVGYTAPAIAGQAAVLRAALARAGVAAESVGYIEAHGTGTALGDPIEVAALDLAYGGRSGPPRALGSLKSNLGHLDAAAGVAGLIKVVLALEAGQVPPTLHFSRLNPAIELTGETFRIPTSLEAWPAGEGPRRAAVSSFGIGGTNAHAVLEQAPPAGETQPGRPWRLLPLSARSPAALEQVAARLAAHLERRPDLSIDDLAFTLQQGRRAFDHRSFVVCAEPASAVASLGAPGLARRRVKAGEPPPVYFLFPGQGSQHPGMAGEIYRTEPLFRAGLDEALDLMGSELAGRLRPLLLADPGTEREARAVELRDTRLAQPALFACEHALARLWMSWGVQPAAMLGHSVGEYVAASLAGVLPFADALALVVARAELMAAAPAGRMLAVELAEDELSGLLAPSLDLAAVNAPRLVVAAGSEAASAALAAELAGRGIEHRFLHTSHAFHSRLLDAVVEPFVRRVAACRLAPPQLPVVSNLTGSWLTQEEATDPAYWGRHLRSTVRFAAGLATLGDAGEGVLLEVGPGQALSRLARRQGERSHGRVVASLPAAASEEPAARHLVEAAGRLWLHGSELDWSAFQGTARRRVALPTYPFERSRFRLKPAPRAAPEVPARLPLERWFHVPSFQPAPPLLPPVEARRDILLLADRGGVGAALAHHLAAAGHRVTSAHTGASDDPDALAIDGTSRTGFASLFSRLAALGRDPDLVVSTAALDLATSPGHGGDLAASFWQPLFLLQAAPPSRDRRLVLVTAGALAMGPGEVPLPAAAAALAFPRVAALELPAWKCRLVDLAASALHRPGLIDDLIVEMLQEEAPAAVAWRAGRRWVEGLAPSSLPAAPTRFREEGGYLLTGGLGGMGLTFARALASRYRARVALVARTPLPARPAWEGVIAADPGSPLARQLATLLAIEGEGGRVLTLAADVADAEQLAQAVATARQQLGRLDGVVHAAGVPGGGLLTARSAAQASVVLAPKVAGTVALAQALDGEKLDFVLLCSSLTASLGGVGQLDYCAANLFLEAFAETASASGSTPWIAAGWDGWRDLGMLASADLPAEVRQLRAAELARGLTADEGVAALERLITHGGPRVVLSVSDLTARREAIQALSLASFLSSDNALAASHARPDLDSPFVAARTPVEQALVALWSELLGVEGIGVEDDFFALGGHSLLATRLLTRVRERFGVALALQALIESPTVAALAARLAGGQVSDQVSGQASPEPELTALVPQPDDLHEPFPLTAIQRAYWIGRGEAFELGNVSAHVYLELAAERLPLATLTHAWRRLIARHPMLRAIVLPDGRQQVLARVPSYTIRTVDLRGLPEPEREARLAHFRAERSHHMLASERWPLFEIRACLLPVGYRLQVSIDFLLIDEWSMQVLLRELASLVVEPARKLPPLGLSFRDYVLAERELHAGQRHARDLAYWQERCKELPPPPDLPLAKDPSEVRAPRFVRHQAWLPGDVWGQLKRRAAELAITPSGLLLAAFAEALAGWCRSRRFLLNLTLFNRLPFHPQVGELVGDFTHLSLLAVEWERGDSFGDRARRLQARLWQDLEHRTASGEQALRQRGAEDRRRALAPVVFTSTLGLASEVDHAAALSTLGEVVYSVTQTPQVWLDHVVRERAGGLAYNWDVVAELFPTGLIESLFSAYGELLQRLASDGACLAERRLLGLPGPQRASRERVNATAVPRPALLLDQLALRHAPRQPQAPAVLTDRRSLSHSELAAEAAHWERALRRLGAGPETLVAVVMEKGWEQAVAVLAVLGAGAAYLPIDPALPRERLHHLLRVGEARLALTQPQFATALDWPAAVTVLGVVANPGGDDGGPVPAAPARSPADLAYVLFTSGSTGVPKGVMIEHRGAVNTLLDLERRFAIGPDDRVLALSALSFDLSVYDLFGLPAAGGAVVIPAAGCERDPEHWWEQCERYGVTVWNTVPALMEMLVTDLESRRRRLPAGLRLVLLSGDWIPLGLPDRIRRLRDGVAVISLGGATEASIWSILYPIGEVAPEWKSIPYGRPMENQGFQVVDADGEPCPDWVPGELLISGLGVARGYWRDEARTAASFPRSADGGRLYRTGDLGRYWPDGTLEFLGREDSQVKVRGHRIELGEIEATLASHPAVREAVATAHGPARGDRSLVAYWVPAGGAAASEPELLAFLASRLPEYMLPRRVLPLAQLPLTANGKLDRKALPPPEAPATPGRRGEPPRPGREEDLARLWRELVPGSNPARDDDFFAAGGDSLLATRLVSRLREELRLEVPLRAFFDTPTVAGLAAAVAARASSSGEASDPWAAPIPRVARGTGLAASFSQERLWFLDRLSSGDSSYHIGAVFRLSGRLDVGRLTAALAKVVARHEALRTTLRDDGRRLLQWVAASAACRVPVLDLGGLPLAAQAASAQRASSAAVDRPFDLGRLPLLRCCLLRLGAELHRVVLVIHHSIADGWSMGVLVREISELYRAAAEKRRPDLPPLPIQYADFAAWERRWLASPAAGAELAHWREVLRPPRASLELPSDRPRPAVLSSSGAYRYFVLDAALRRDLEAVAQQHGMTEFMVLLTGFKLLLAAHTGVHDLLVGTPIAHRNRRETEGLVGPFLNTVVLRTDLPRGLSLADALRRVRATAVAAYAHQDLPFEKLVEDLAGERDLARSPLFQVLFQLQEIPLEELVLPGLVCEPEELLQRTAILDLSVGLREAGAQLMGFCRYSTDLFDATTIERLLAHYQRLLRALAAGGLGTVADVDRALLSAAERQQLLSEWQDTAAAVALPPTLSAGLARAERQHAEAIAVCDREEQLSYRELARRAAWPAAGAGAPAGRPGGRPPPPRARRGGGGGGGGGPPPPRRRPRIDRRHRHRPLGGPGGRPGRRPRCRRRLPASRQRAS